MEYEFRTKGYEDFELSTQMIIKEAGNRGITVEILDKKENFIRLKRGSVAEIVKQATKTSLDSYVTYLIMENKEVTKTMLSEKGIRVPQGKAFDSIEEAAGGFENFKELDIVVKPKSTNYGTGITILKNDNTHSFRDEYKKAVEYAFTFDNTVLVEEFLEGKEYRFLVIGDEVTAVMHRVPANVTGNGKDTISRLIEKKNDNPLRGKGHITPLEKITLGSQELSYLALQDKSPQYVPKEGERVFLRENSNISTGGDSIDYTDKVHEDYNTLAIEAAKIAGAKICGVDLIIKDPRQTPHRDNYGIIELNFNPALHMHAFPYEGINRHPEKKVLDLLGFKEA